MSFRDRAWPWSWTARLGAVHDGITRAGFYLSGLCLAVIVASFCIEIVGRYFFSSPTHWSSSMVAYMLCAMLFLVTPELARVQSHILISVVPDTLSPKAATRYMRIVYLFSCIVCVIAGWFCLSVAVSQYQSGIATVNEWRIPKWWLSSLIPYSLFSASLYFMRHAFNSELQGASGLSLS